MKRNLLDAATIEEPREVNIPDLGSLDSVVLPAIVSMQAPKPAVRDELLDASEGMDEITDLAIAKAREILELPLDRYDGDNFATILRQQGSTVATILTTQVRVDEGRFKKKQADKLGELLDLIRSEEARMVVPRVLN